VSAGTSRSLWLQTIEETLPSLLNGLKLIWTISRHINQNEDKFENILEAISNEICSKVRQEIDIKKIFDEKPIPNAIKKIDQAICVLKNWKEQYDKTKQEIEIANTMNRWEFTNTKNIFAKPAHMVNILQDICNACKVLKEFQEILGPDLK
jgi:dynein heavy chain